MTASRLSKGVKARLDNAGAQGPAGPEGKQGVEGRQGPEGKQGSQGPAGEALLGSEPPSDLYVTDTFASPFSGALAKETEATVASIRLAPGDYLITAKAGALAGPAEGAVAGELSCELHDESGDVVDSAGPGVAADLNVEDVLTGPLSLSTEQTVSLDCFANDLKLTFFPKGTRIMALPVASIRG